MVRRIALSGADAPAPTAVLKVSGEGSATSQNEAAAAAYFGRSAAGLTPDLLALDGAHRLVVLTDLGDHRQLSDVLLAGDAGAAERALLAWGHGLGSLLAATFGGRTEFERTRSGLGLDPDSPGRSRLRTACDELAEAVRSRLGVTAPAALAGELAAALALVEDPAWEVVTPADMCPDNNLLTPSGVRFLDLEFAGCSSVFLQAAYARLLFPTCWCVFDTSPGLMQRVEDALRRPLARARPELAADDSWRSGVAGGCLLWTVIRVVWLLTRPPEELHLGTWDRDGLAVPMWDRITLHYLARVGYTVGPNCRPPSSCCRRCTPASSTSSATSPSHRILPSGDARSFVRGPTDMSELPVANGDGSVLLTFDRIAERDLDRLDPAVPLTAALVVLWWQGRCLLVFNRFCRVWELPVGMLDDGESPRAAAFRELAEESGQRPDDLDLAGVARCMVAPDGQPEFLAIYRGGVASPLPFVPNDEMSRSTCGILATSCRTCFPSTPRSRCCAPWPLARRRPRARGG